MREGEVGEHLDALHHEDVKGSIERSNATTRMNAYLNSNELREPVSHEEIKAYIIETKKLMEGPDVTDFVKEGYKKMIYALEDKMSGEKLDSLRSDLERKGTY